MDIHIVYHDNDLDGICSGMIAYRYCDWLRQVGIHNNGESDINITLHGWDYDDRPIPNIPDRHVVYVLDICFPLPDMVDLNKRTDLYWIDHHKTSMEMMAGSTIAGKREVGLAACELAWSFFFPNMQIPDGIAMLGIYDTWRKDSAWNWDDEIMPFQYGMRTYKYDPTTFPWDLLNDPKSGIVPDRINAGRDILDFLNVFWAGLVKQKSFESDFCGYRAICLNTDSSSSNVFGDKLKEYDLGLVFTYINGKWKVSLYSENIDVSILAKQNNGGGHRGAAGFLTKSIEFIIDL